MLGRKQHVADAPHRQHCQFQRAPQQQQQQQQAMQQQLFSRLRFAQS